ncbi:hypothetical protein A4V02_11980 [Muribaculum intestinale]|jgi:hypothetical protein|uniref:DUF4294 domain-containing protein n=2 Tax=Bacteroidales TaxID=171549 RepID=A0A1B1SDJ1_9BACT|nr:hypothetical protein A4V02_11980 [Muribaculum intestinale]ASB39062.1 hypothetical protein ADH68_05730 [Muribaculum intestinale]
MILSCVVSVSAQDDTSDGVVGILDEPTLKDARIPLVRGRYHFVSEEGDTAIMVVLNNITYFPPLKFKNKKQEQFYWRTVRDVKRTLPYAKMIAETILETYEYMETLPSQEERQRHLQQMEKEVFNQYKPQLKKFTKSQGKMLVKLITRETNQSSYSILKAFLGTFRAGFWQTFGRFFGVNLKSDFRPDKNEEDAIIERVCVLVEQGML